MKVAVTDACIFIDLLEAEACTAFFNLDLEVITSQQIWLELEVEQRNILEEWIDKDRLSIKSGGHNLLKIREDNKLSVSLSIADLTAWALASDQDGILLTSDGALRKTAKANNIETHGLLWIFDQIVEHELLSKKDAIAKLRLIFEQNLYYRSDRKLFDAFEAFILKW
jgi:predicted nucleic acid-binding protein